MAKNGGFRVSAWLIWEGLGWVLGGFWVGLGVGLGKVLVWILGGFWEGFGWVLGRFWEGLGVDLGWILGRFWVGLGKVLGGSTGPQEIIVKIS